MITSAALASTTSVVRFESGPGHAWPYRVKEGGDQVSKIMIGRYQGTIYPEGEGYTGAISLGFDRKGKRRRIKRKAKTKAEVRDRLVRAIDDLEAGIKSDATYTVEDCVNDWLEKGLKRRSESTAVTYRSIAKGHIFPTIGKVKLKGLTADDLDEWLDERAEVLSTRSLRLIHQIVRHSIRHAQARDKVRRNVASLVDVPEGQEGRPSKALDLDQAKAVISTAMGASRSRVREYVIVCLLCGLRTEEARALRWSEVDLDAATVAVYRSVRAKGDTKTRRSRRVLQLPKWAVRELRRVRKRQAAEQLAAGDTWQQHDLVFCREDGSPMDHHYVRREFKKITKAAGIGEGWTPRELRHSFVSLLSAHDVALEEISRLVGHTSTTITETVYRHEIRPALTTGAEAMDKIFQTKTTSKSRARARTKSA